MLVGPPHDRHTGNGTYNATSGELSARYTSDPYRTYGGALNKEGTRIYYNDHSVR